MASGVIDVVIQQVIGSVIVPVIGPDGGIRLVSGITETNAGAPSANQLTVCWPVPVTVADPTSGASLTVNSVPTPITYVEKDVGNTCYTYQLVAGTWAPGDDIVFCIDNGSGDWTESSSGDPVSSSCVGVVNLFNAPIALTATIPALGNEIIVTFDTSVTDSGGTVVAYNCTKGIHVPLDPPTGNGTDTLTYPVLAGIYDGDNIQWTADGVTINCTLFLLRGWDGGFSGGFG